MSAEKLSKFVFESSLGSINGSIIPQTEQWTSDLSPINSESALGQVPPEARFYVARVEKYLPNGEQLEMNGLFANREFQKGEVVYNLVIGEVGDDGTLIDTGALVDWRESVEGCANYGLTFVLPNANAENGLVLCQQPGTPFSMSNHSCDHNIEFAHFGLPVAIKENERAFLCVQFVARRSIHKGEEITLPYSSIVNPQDGGYDRVTVEGKERVRFSEWKLEGCLCGQPNCRHTIEHFHTLPT
jgi:hypothetical protein